MEGLSLGKVGVVVSLLAWAGLVISILTLSVAGYEHTATWLSWLSALVAAVLSTLVNTLAVFVEVNKKVAVIGLMLAVSQFAALLLSMNIFGITSDVLANRLMGLSP